MSSALTQAQLEALRIQIQRQRQALRALIDAHQAEAMHHERSDSETEHAAQVAATAVNEAEERLADLHEQEIGSHELALQRLESGDYGTCADCDKPIGYPRLQAWPTALRCVPCQDAFEHARLRG